jgi:DNA-binding response OmpR family regulator
MSARILVVDDDLTMGEVVGEYLRDAGLEARHAADGPSALSVAEQWPPDLVVLDLMLPGIDGLEVCRRLRAAHGSQQALPVIMLTALGEEADRVLGLEAGADDYVTKPFSPRELLARVQAAMRRANRLAAVPEIFSFDDVSVNFTKMELTQAGKPAALTAQEFKVLRFFIQNQDRVISREELLNEVWGYQSYPSTRTVDNHILRLRQKLEKDPARPLHFKTVHGAGYRFVR